MGSAVSLPTAVALCLIAGAIVYGFVQSHPNPPQPVSRAKTNENSGGRKGKKKKVAQAEQVASTSATEKTPAAPIVVPFPTVIPGGFEGDATAAAPAKPKPKKKKAKKAASANATSASRADDAQSESSATAPESSTPVPRTKRRTPPAIDSDGPWTRVESRKRPSRPQDLTAGATAPEPITSDAGITTSVTGTTEPTEDEQEQEQQLSEREPENRRTLAERLLPKPRKTGVEDLLETPDVPPLARVMRVKPRPDERPAVGFSWADYEDVDDSRMTADDADSEDEGEWIVKSSNRRLKPKASPSQVPQTAPETMTKKQRQNQAKRDAQKAAREEAEVQRLEILAAHARDLERTRIAEQSAKKVGGGMKAAVSGGHLVFE